MDLANIQNPKYDGFSFGVEPSLLAATLRRFADDLDARRINVSHVRLIQRTDQENFYEHSLIMRFNERIPVQNPLPPING